MRAPKQCFCPGREATVSAPICVALTGMASIAQHHELNRVPGICAIGTSLEPDSSSFWNLPGYCRHCLTKRNMPTKRP